MKTFKNKKPVMLRNDYDTKNPFTRLSNSLLLLNPWERLIMWELLSNSDDFIINKNLVEKRVGIPHKKFLDAWKTLEEKYFISSERFFGGVKWIINENPNKCHSKVTTSEQEINKDTSIINTDIIDTGSILTTTNITTNNINKSLDTILSKGAILTNTISVANATDSILDQDAVASIPIHIEYISLLSNIGDDFNIEFNTDMEQY